MEDDVLEAVTKRSIAAATEIRANLTEDLGRLEFADFCLSAAYVSMAIDALDRELERLTALRSISEMG